MKGYKNIVWITITDLTDNYIFFCLFLRRMSQLIKIQLPNEASSRINLSHEVHARRKYMHVEFHV